MVPSGSKSRCCCVRRAAIGVKQAGLCSQFSGEPRKVGLPTPGVSLSRERQGLGSNTEPVLMIVNLGKGEGGRRTLNGSHDRRQIRKEKDIGKEAERSVEK